MAREPLPYSQFVASGDFVFTAGQVAFDDEGRPLEGGIEVQVRRTLENLRDVLAEAGCGLADVVKVTAFLADLGTFEAYNRVYREFFTPPYPARTSVGASLPPGILVEIEAVARRPA
jgi:2-iminobutanoate/2-iminopropanoate deaminase